MGATLELELDMINCRGQGYDGAAAVSGSKNDMAVDIIKKSPKSYLHSLLLS